MNGPESPPLSQSQSLPTSETVLLVSIALVKLAVHLAVNLFGGYGYVRDELYYIACSDHMAWGYVDHPPLSIAILWLSRLVFGDSVFAIRLLPAVSGSLVVVLTGLTTRELGGKLFAQGCACCCVLAAPLILGMDSIFSMNSFDVFFWTLAVYFIILAVKKGEEKYWLFLGLTLGLGLLNKISVLWLGAGIVAGLLVTPERKLFLTRKVWIAGSLAFLLFLPHILWQAANGYPTLEFIRNAGSGKYVALSPWEMLLQQTLFMNPVTFPVWISGLIYFLVSRSSKQFRILPVLYLTVFLILVINRNSKAAYLVPILPMLFALGGVATETFAKQGWRWLKPAAPVLVLSSGVFLAPMVLAVLPVETYIKYSAALGVAPSTSENHRMGRLPQHYADMFGWPEMVAAVAGAYNTLSVEERNRCTILCNNYGEAGAIDFFGKRYGLPKAVSGHNNYWLWGPGNADGGVVIRLGGSEEAVKAAYESAFEAAVFRNDYCMPYESNMSIWVCRNRRTPLRQDWPQFKVFN